MSADAPDPASPPRNETPNRASTPMTPTANDPFPPAASRERTTPRPRRLGAGMVEVTSAPLRDPADAVMVDPQVAESRRFCARCFEPVGRSRNGQPGRAVGFCRACGAPFSFEPKLTAGTLVAGQYEVFGCLAHGGMGWVYLARDHNVSDRWVVLKGLLNAEDSDSTAAALAERRFLAEVEHPNIVKIFNFVQHETAGYIVMEYVGGPSLKQILAARQEANGGAPDPLPLAQAIAYILEVLPALGYLHELGLVFCDFKLENVIQTQHSLKLIDLGGVSRLDEPTDAVFGTVGYQAPEVGDVGPSVTSDLFTVTRALALLCIDLPGYRNRYRFTLPGRGSVRLFERYDSLYRLLLKGTAPIPEDRFQSADEMAAQLYGVLREVIAETDGRIVPAASTLFTAAARASLERPDWRVLPRPQVSSDDPGAAYLATITAGEPQQLIADLKAAPQQTIGIALRLTAALLEVGDIAGAEPVLDGIEASNRREWRAYWYRGLAALAQERAGDAIASFTVVYHALPGELAPKLALATACELAGELEQASCWYDIVSRTEPTTTSASFGLARCRLQLGDRAAALSAYERVPDSSSGYLDAQVARVRSLGAPNGATLPAMEELVTAAGILEALPLEHERRDRLTAELLESALELTLTGTGVDDASVTVLGCRLNERDLRFGLERAYRAIARHAETRQERVRLVDQANAKRPRTWT